MLKEVLDFLEPAKGGVVVDGTLGLAGHSKAILEKLSPARLVGMDRDGATLRLAESHLALFKDKVTLMNENFKNIRQ